MAIGRIKVRVGVERARKPAFASEPNFVRDVKKQLDAVMADLEDIFDQFKDVTPDIIEEALRPTFEKSQTYVPRRTGDLARSGYLQITQRGDRPYVEIGYGKNGVPRYALQVHELTNQAHKPPTRAKFLQSAIDEDMDKISSRIAAGYKRFMGA